MADFDLRSYGQSSVAVVIPARNEAPTIADLVRRSAPLADRVVVMDGHSTDGTGDLARGAGATVIQDPGRGKGSAVRAALSQVDEDVLVFMDADGSHDPADVPRLVLPIIRNELDLCVGSRFAGGSDELSVSMGQLIRTIGNISMNIAINTRWKVELTDTLNGFRGVRRAAALSVGLREDRHTIEQEMVMKMLRHRYRVGNAPTHEYARQHGASHINIWREWPKFVWCVVENLVPRDLPPRAPQSAAPPAPVAVAAEVEASRL
jgi:dolichol-phosphate mannosyltransferase